MSDRDLAFDSNYGPWLYQLKAQIRQVQVQAAIAINRELVLLYWYIGQQILVQQREAGLGSKGD